MSHKLRLGAIIIIRNGAKTRSPQNFRVCNKKRSKNNKSPNVVWETKLPYDHDQDGPGTQYSQP
jgi:hypothetical protein